MALTDLTPVTRMESILNGDDIEPVTREEYFWQQATTSGSGGLPDYTPSDVGKVLTVKEADPVETEVVVVPEQSVTFTNEGRPETPQYIGVLTGVNLASLSDGDTVTIYVNGTAYTEHYTPTESYPIDGDVKIYRRNSDNEWVAELSYDGATEGTYTISATAVTSVTPSVQTVIVPEQTVTLSEENPFAVLTGADITAFQNLKVGDVASAVINGVTYQATAISSGGDATVYAISEIEVMIGYAPNIGVVLGLGDEPNYGDYTIRMTATVPSVAPVWETGGMVQITIDPDTHSLPLSYNDLAGLLGKKDVVFIITDNGSTIMYRLASYVIADGTYMVAFSNPIDSKTAIFVSQSPDGPMAPK